MAKSQPTQVPSKIVEIAMQPPAKGFKKVRAITLPFLKVEPETLYYVRFDVPMFVGKKIDDKKEPATLTRVTNLETGEQCEMIVPAVLKSILTETYDQDGYVGRSFELVKHIPAEGKKYSRFDVAEVHYEMDSEQAA